MKILRLKYSPMLVIYKALTFWSLYLSDSQMASERQIIQFSSLEITASYFGAIS